MKKIAIIGTGNLGRSIVEGLLKDNPSHAKNIHATRNQINKISDLQEKGVTVSNNNLEATNWAQVIILAVKPYKINSILQEINPSITNDKIIVSLASGINITDIQKTITNQPTILRAMPNTASAVEESITCIAGNTTDQDINKTVASIFDNFGKTLFINEELMNAATVIGACGIAYALRFIRAMTQGGIEIGFDAKTANLLVAQTVKGAAELLLTNHTHPEEEIDKVTTPKGCTIAGLNEMEHQGFSASLIKGIQTSYKQIQNDM